MLQAVRKVIQLRESDGLFKQMFDLSEGIALRGNNIHWTKLPKKFISSLPNERRVPGLTGKLFYPVSLDGQSLKPLVIGHQIGDRTTGTAKALKLFKINGDELTPAGEVLKVPKYPGFNGRVTTSQTATNSQKIEGSGLGYHILKTVGIGRIGRLTATVQEELPPGYFTLAGERGYGVFDCASDVALSHLPDEARRALSSLSNTQMKNMNLTVQNSYRQAAQEISSRTGIEIETSTLGNYTTKLEINPSSESTLPVIHPPKIFDYV